AAKEHSAMEESIAEQKAVSQQTEASADKSAQGSAEPAKATEEDDSIRFWNRPSQRQPWRGAEPSYEADYLAVWEKNPGFLDDLRFCSAYRRGINSGHGFNAHYGDDDPDIHIEWRVHVACWAAMYAARL